jgi:diguanylate cyclase (GGDEF)-like protein
MAAAQKPSGAARAFLRETFALYTATDRTSAELRAQLLMQLLRGTPTMMAANVVCGLCAVWALHANAGPVIWVWLVALFALVVTALSAWRRIRAAAPVAVSTGTFRRSALHAAALGSVWAVVPALWFASGDPNQQLTIAILASGTLAAGGFSLAPMPLSSIAYVGFVAVGSVIGLLAAREPELSVLSLLLLCYAAVVIAGAILIARQGEALLRSRLEQQRQGELVSLLLKDFEEQASDALWDTDADGRLVHASARLAKLMDAPAETLIGEHWLRWLQRHAKDTDGLGQAMLAGRAFRDERIEVNAGAGAGAGAEPRWWSVSGTPTGNDVGAVRGWRGVVADVTATVQADQRLRDLAHRDALTGLANRTSLHAALRDALASQRAGALLAIDLDHFKVINDTLGHSVGDEVLRHVAQRLRKAVRPDDLVARLGGDEFAVLLGPSASTSGSVSGSAPDAELQALAERLVELLQAPLVLPGRTLHVGASLGLATLGDGTLTVEEVMGNADLALYDAKGSGRGRVAAYNAAIGEWGRRRSAVEQALRDALRHGELELVYQPKVSLDGWQVRSVEALMRWRHGQLGVVAPAEFIPAAERCGLIHEIGRWALHRACAAAAKLEGRTVAVNVSPLQVMDHAFVDDVRSALQATKVDPACIELEITESVLLDDAGAAIEQLHRLRELGVRIVLDDFGTGYSSLAYLRRFPFDALKIDSAFVRESVQRSDVRAIVAMIVRLADELGMDCVAEGVETPAQLRLVTEIGCHEAQGFLVSRPVGLQTLRGQLAQWSERPASGAVH